MFTELMASGSGGGGGDIKEACAVARMYPTVGYNGQYVDTAGNGVYNTYTPTITTDYFRIDNGYIYANQDGIYGYTRMSSTTKTSEENTYSQGDLIYNLSTLTDLSNIIVYAK